MLAPAVDIAGDYTLTFIADSTCTALPNELRTRTYVATITPSSSPNTDLPNLPANTAFDVTVSGAPFLENYNRGLLYVAGDHLAMWIGDVEPGLVELVAANTYFGIGPVGATASVGTPVSTISTSLNGWMDYCVLPSAMGSSYSCGPKATAHARCQSKNHQLILTRR